MAANFTTLDGKRTAELLARSVALQWCGLDADADQLRQAIAQLTFDYLLRADVVSSGKTSAALGQLINTLSTAGDPVEPIVQVQISSEERAAQTLARVLLSFLPSYLRSLEAFIAYFTPGQAAPKAPSGPPPPSPRQSQEQQTLEKAIAALALPQPA